jgi:hypothetical protein
MRRKAYGGVEMMPWGQAEAGMRKRGPRRRARGGLRSWGAKVQTVPKPLSLNPLDPTPYTTHVDPILYTKTLHYYILHPDSYILSSSP